MPKKIQKTKDLKGLFIYHDPHHGTVYYDILSRNGYILTNDNVKYYALSISFLPIAVIIFYFAMQFRLNTVLCLTLALAFYVVAHTIYRYAFLYKLPCVENYNAKKTVGIFDNLVKNYSKSRLIVLAVFLVALVLTTAAYVLTSDFTGILLIAMWAVVALTAIFLLVVIIAITKK